MPVRMRQMTTPLDAAEYRLQLAQALQQRAMVPRVPQAGGPVQAQYGMGHGLVDLANALASTMNVRRAEKAYTRAQEAEKAEEEAKAQQQRQAQQEALAAMLGGQNAGDGMGPPTPAPSYEQTIGLTANYLEHGGAPEIARALMEARKPKAPDRVDLGDRIELMDQSGRIVGTRTKGATPDATMRERGAMYRWQQPSGSARLSADTARRGQDMSAETARRGQDMTRQTALESSGGKAPPGYQWTPAGTLEPIPGGPAAMEYDKVAAANNEKQRQALAKVDTVMPYIDRALGQLGGMTTGLVGAGMKHLPGSDAFDLGETMETIKANIGFDALQAMRAASPTGGALGQVAIQELYALQASLGSLNQAQSQAQVASNLEAVKRHYQNWRSVMEQSRQAPATPPSAPDPMAAISGYMQRYGGQ